ncbi:putative membrane protein [Mycobacterium avium subsp. avium 2285 (R)]|nr:putative membrane protein [Mycobacterium avium subsp. avium 2285 (R)]
MRWTRPGYALVLALLVVGPLLRPGYLLLRDAVSTPRSYLSDTALGLTAAPRAVPQDFAVALASHLLDGGVVVKTLLLLGLWLAGWGAARLVALVLPGAGMPGEFVATTLAIWNPYVAERLLQGHWSLLVGYGCLPWVATAMLGLRTGGAGFFGLAFFIALAGLTPTGLLLAAAVALACVPVAGAGRRRWVWAAAAIGAAAVAALPWLVAAVTGAALPSHTPANRLGVEAFAPRAEPGLGTLTSLASLGGIWNADAVPGSRTTLFAVASAVVLLGVVAVGLPAVARRPAAVPLLVLAAAAVLIPAGWPPARAAAAGRGGRRRAGCRGAARRAEVGGAGGARLRAGRCRRGADAAAPAFRGRRPGAGVLPGADPGAARPGLGRGRQGVAGALPARLAGRRGGD